MNSPAIIRLRTVPAAMKALDRLEEDIRKAPTFDALNTLARDAQELQRRWRPVKVVADRAGECWTEAEDKLGEELAALPKATGTRGQLAGKQPGTAKKGKGRGYTGEAKLVPPVYPPTDADRGVGKRQAARARKLFLYKRDEGGFEGWVESRLRYSRTTAYNLLTVHERFGESVQSLDTLPRSVLYLLARPSTPDEVRQEAGERLQAFASRPC
jgi:hypothetical protein